MSTILSGGRAYGFAIEVVKSSSTSSRISQSSSSPSSTLSESSNSPVAISTRKTRTPRKRPNQTYNEAATLLSTACPNVFSTKHIKKISKFTPQNSYYFNELPELVLPFRVIENSGFLLHPPLLEHPNCLIEPKVCEKPCLSPVEINSSSSSSPQWNSNSVELSDDFDTESMLDEEMGEGIDSIMGNSKTENDSAIDESNTISWNNTCYGFPIGLGFNSTFEFGFGMRNSVRALRNVDEGNWWRIRTVNIADITPKPAKKVVEEKKKKKKKVEKALSVELKGPELNSIPISEPSGRLLLKLNYDDILDAWSDRANPLPDEISGSESAGGTGNDIHARLAEIDLFSCREASVMRYKEKRRNRLFSKKIRYQVRKLNADRRPRIKGRFVRRPNSPISEEG